MKRIEAIALLIACKPLVERLVAYGSNMELSDEDRTIITGFTKARLEEWLNDKDICLQTGLDISEMNILNLIATKVRVEEKRQLLQAATGVWEMAL